MASGGGGAWKVAYADFVTAMMAFFMVMWLTAQKPEVVTAVAEHFRNQRTHFGDNHHRLGMRVRSMLIPRENRCRGT